MPLTILKTQVEVERGSSDPALMSESLDAMAVRLDHTIALTERLLLLARLKSDECSGLRQREPMELTALVRDIAYYHHGELGCCRQPSWGACW